MLNRVWTISNFLSFSRVLLVAPLAYCILADVSQKRSWVALIIVIATITDFLDGYIARKRHEVSELGKIIDPLADKVAAGATAALLVWTGDLPLWYVVVVIVRDLLILLGGIYIKKRKNIIAQSNWPGKIAISTIVLVLLLSALQQPGLESLRQFAIWASVLLMTISFGVYVQRLFIGSTIGKRNTA